MRILKSKKYQKLLLLCYAEKNVIVSKASTVFTKQTKFAWQYVHFDCLLLSRYEVKKSFFLMFLILHFHVGKQSAKILDFKNVDFFADSFRESILLRFFFLLHSEEEARQLRLVPARTCAYASFCTLN